MEPEQQPQQTERHKLAPESTQVELELENLKLEVGKLKHQTKPSRLNQVLTNPAFLAALITALVTGAIAVLSDRNAANQREIEEARFKQELNKSILLTIINPGDPSQIAPKLKLFLDTGLLVDQDGKFREAQYGLEKAIQLQILQNIILAAHDQPLVFDQHFDRDFYDALLRPVHLNVLSYFIRGGYSRELLFWLFVDSLEIAEPTRATIGFQYNPPYDFGCNKYDRKERCMSEWAEIAVITGLTVEEVAVDAGGDSKGGKGKDKGKSKGGDGGGKETVEFARFCFSAVSADRGSRAMTPERLAIIKALYIDEGLTLSSFTPRCGQPWDPVREQVLGDVLIFNAGPVRFRVVPRSTYSVFQFLGKVLLQSMSNAPPIQGAYLPRPEEELPLLSTVGEDQRLIYIVLKSSEDCFVETKFTEGTYCVPEHQSANTKRIFGMLTQLIALQTTAR